MSAAGPTRAAPPLEVEITLLSPEEDARALEATLRELCGRLGVSPRVRGAGQEPEAAPATPRARSGRHFVVHIDARATAERPAATIAMRPPEGAHAVTRRVPLPRGLDEVAREQIGLVVADAVGALLAGGMVPESNEGGGDRDRGDHDRSDALPSASDAGPAPLAGGERAPEAGGARSTSVRAPSSPRALGWEVGLLYGLGRLGADAPMTHGPGLTAALVVRGTAWSIGGLASLGADLPSDVRSERVALGLRETRLRLLGLVERALGEGLRLRGGVGLALVDTALDPKALAPGVDATEARHGLSARGTALLGIARSFGPLDVCLSLHVDAAPWSTRYVVARPDGSQVLFEGAPVRLGLNVALAWRGGER
jgi:hypothetical protein